MKHLEGVLKTTGIFACVNSINAVEVACIFPYEKFNDEVKMNYNDFFTKYKDQIEKVIKDYKSHEETYFKYRNVFNFFNVFNESLKNYIQIMYDESYNVIDGISKYRSKIKDFKDNLNTLYEDFKYSNIKPTEDEINKLFEKIENDDLYNTSNFENFKKDIVKYKQKFIAAIKEMSELEKHIDRTYFDNQEKLNKTISSEMSDNLKKHINYFVITDKVEIYFKQRFSSDRNKIVNAKELNVVSRVNYNDKSYYDSNNLLETASGKYFKLKETIFTKIENVKKIIIDQRLGSLYQEFTDPNNKSKTITLKEYLENTLNGLNTKEKVKGIDFDKRHNYYDVEDSEEKLEIYVNFNEYDSNYLDCGEININTKTIEGKETFVPLNIDSYKLEDGVLYESEEKLKYIIAKMCIDKIKDSINKYKTYNKLTYDFANVFNEEAYKTIVKDIRVKDKEEIEINGKKFIFKATVEIDYDDAIYVSTDSKEAFEQYFKEEYGGYGIALNDNLGHWAKQEENNINSLNEKLDKLNELETNLKDDFYLKYLGLSSFIKNKKVEINLALEKHMKRKAIYDFYKDKDKDKKFFLGGAKILENYLYSRGEATKDQAINAIKKHYTNIDKLIEDALSFNFNEVAKQEEIKYEPFKNDCVNNIFKAYETIEAAKKADEEGKRDKETPIEMKPGKDSEDAKILNNLNKLLSSVKEGDKSDEISTKLSNIVGDKNLSDELQSAVNKINNVINEKRSKELNSATNETEKHNIAGKSLKKLLDNSNIKSSSQMQTELNSIINNYDNPNKENADITKQIQDKIAAKKKEEQNREAAKKKEEQNKQGESEGETEGGNIQNNSEEKEKGGCCKGGKRCCKRK